MKTTTKRFLLILIGASAVALTGCGGGDESSSSTPGNTANNTTAASRNNSRTTDNSTTDNNGAPATLAGKTMTLTVTSVSGNGFVSPHARPFQEPDPGIIYSGGLAHEPPGMSYSIDFIDDHTAIVHHPDIKEPDESMTYTYDAKAGTIQFNGASHDMVQLVFSSNHDGTAHVEDSSGHIEDDRFVLS